MSQLINNPPPSGNVHQPRGFADWLCEDAEGRFFSPPDAMKALGPISQWCHEVAVKPVRLTLQKHAKGSGVVHESRRRITFVKPETHVWFFDAPDETDGRPHYKQDAPLRNLARGMPRALYARLYNVSDETVRQICLANNWKKLDGVDAGAVD